VILIEMLSRVIKDIIRKQLRDKMKEIKHPGEGAYRREVVNILNILFGETHDSRVYWSTVVFPTLVDKYYNSEFQSIGSCLKDEVNFQLHNEDGRWILLQRLVIVLGLQFANASWVSFQRDSAEQLFSCPKPFEETDLAEMKGKVKSLDIVALANGFVLKTKALMTASSPEERTRLLTLAIDSFESAKQSNPNNVDSLLNLADCKMLLNEREQSKELYRRALTLQQRNPVALFKYGCYKEFIGEFDSAEKYYKFSLEAYPSFSNCHVVLADLLTRNMKQYDRAEYHYRQALVAAPENQCALNNYAIFQLVIRKNVEEAETLFLQLIKDANNPIHLKNVSIFLSVVKKDKQAAKHYQELHRQRAHLRNSVH